MGVDALCVDAQTYIKNCEPCAHKEGIQVESECVSVQCRAMEALKGLSESGGTDESAIGTCQAIQRQAIAKRGDLPECEAMKRVLELLTDLENPLKIFDVVFNAASASPKQDWLTELFN